MPRQLIVTLVLEDEFTGTATTAIDMVSNAISNTRSDWFHMFVQDDPDIAPEGDWT